MSFLFPLYLLGAAALVIPVLLHLRRRPPQEVVPFSALMFLEAAPVPPVKRRKLEDLLLLALRCLALLLLAFMFSRPLLATREFANATARGWVILLDQSASMRRDNIRPQIEEQIDAALTGVRETDEVTLVAFDREARIIADAGAWSATPQGQRKAWLRQQARLIEPGWGGTDLGRALVFAAGLLDSTGGGDETVARERRVALISDLQDGASLEALGNFAWPQEVSVRLFTTRPDAAGNLSLSTVPRIAEEDAESPAPGAAAVPSQGIRVRVSNSPGSQWEKFSLAWKDSPGPKLEGNVAPGGSRVLQAPPHDAATDGVLELSGDSAAFDNHVFVARTAPRKVRVLFIADLLSRSDPASPLFFFARALKPGMGIEPVIVEKSPRELSAQELEQAEMVVLAARLPEPATAPLRAWLAQGRTLLWCIAAGDDGTSLAKLAGVDGLSFTEAPPGGYAMFGEVHFGHPMLRPFAEAGVRDFSKIRFWKHRVLRLAGGAGIRELAAFDDRSAAIFEVPAAGGRVVALTSGWTPAESQLAVSSKFVPLLYSLLDYAGLASSQDGGLAVGDAIPIEAGQRTAELPVVRPGGRRELWNAIEHAAFTATTEPGVYTIGDGAAAKRHAVNLAPAEGRIAPMDPARLRALGVSLSDGAAARSSGGGADSAIALEDSRREQRQKLWKIIAATLLVVLLLETVVAGLRRRPTAMPAAA